MNATHSATVRAGIILVAVTLLFAYAVFWYGGVVPWNWLVCTVGAGFLGLAACTRSLSAPPPPALEPRLWIPLLLFPAYLLFQMLPLPTALLSLLSPARAELARGLGPIGLRSWLAPVSVAPGATFDMLVRILAYSVILLLVRELFWRMRMVWAAAVPLIALGTLEALLGLYQYASNPAAAIARGTYINRNHMAGMLEMCLPFAAVYAVVLYDRFRSRDDARALRMAAFVAVTGGAVAMALAVLYSLSRSGFAALLISFLVIGILLWRSGFELFHSRTAVAIAIMAALICLFVLPSNRLLERYTEIASGTGPTSTRKPVWDATLQLIAAYPLFGCGAGAYEAAFVKYNPLSFFTADFAHNDYLQGLAELGILGFAIAAAFLLAIVTLAFRVVSPETSWDCRALGLACVGAMSAILFHSLSDFNLYIPANAMLVAWIGGMASGLTFHSEPLPEVVSIGGSTVITVRPLVLE